MHALEGGLCAFVNDFLGLDFFSVDLMSIDGNECRTSVLSIGSGLEGLRKWVFGQFFDFSYFDCRSLG